jgi:hypothetical protein
LQAWGVQVKQIWSVDGELPSTPMGNVDRSPGTSFPGDVHVFQVDEGKGKLRRLKERML